ncbi:MAG: hypothetical protein Q8O56_16955 [Solirubrobacteraceae bacterium]|nr:hypothetical protein [Solirubrobacteraceae bacterium]
MDGFAIPLIIFTALMVLLLVEIIRGSFDDPIPRRAGVIWAVTCPVSGMLFGIGLAPIAIIVGVVSMLALGSLGWWFLATESDDSEGDADEPVEPDPGPSDDMHVEIPDWAKRVEDPDWAKPKSDIDWDAFDRARTEWERELTPKPVAPEPERAPQRELVPAGV